MFVKCLLFRSRVSHDFYCEHLYQLKLFKFAEGRYIFLPLTFHTLDGVHDRWPEAFTFCTNESRLVPASAISSLADSPPVKNLYFFVLLLPIPTR